MTDRLETLKKGFLEAIDTFDAGTISSRGLARWVERLTTTAEVHALNDDLLNHAFWVTRHLLHQPACWAPTIEELHYVARCLRGEETFSMEKTESYR